MNFSICLIQHVSLVPADTFFQNSKTAVIQLLPGWNCALRAQMTAVKEKNKSVDLH